MDSKKITRKMNETMVRIRRDDVPKLDEICAKLQEGNDGIRYSRSDAINILIKLANQTEYLRSTTTE
jgi:hypothetical protein